MIAKASETKFAFEENGVRVATDGAIIVGGSRMSVEEARAFMASIERAIGCYCHQLELRRA